MTPAEISSLHSSASPRTSFISDERKRCISQQEVGGGQEISNPEGGGAFKKNAWQGDGGLALHLCSQSAQIDTN